MSTHPVPDVAPRIAHVAAGDTAARSSFAFAFALGDATDLRIFQDGAALEGGFSVTLNAEGPGGTITLASPAPEGAEIVILRATKLERATDFVENGAFRASALNQELNRLTMMAQELSLALKGGLHRPASEAGAMLVLPGASARASGLLGFGPDGTEVVIRALDELRGEKGETGPQGLPGDMHGSMNLAELTDPAAARANLSVPSRAETDAALSELDTALGGLEMNLALNTLRDVIASGWSLLDMIDGFADAFIDQSGVSIPYVNVTSQVSATSASSSFGGSYVPQNPLTGTAEGWASPLGAGVGGWWQATFPTPVTLSRWDVAVGVDGNSITATVIPQYYNGSAWVDLASPGVINGSSPSSPYSFTFDPVAATQFRLLYTEAQGGTYAYLRQVWFHEGTPTGLSTGHIYDAAGDFYSNQRTSSFGNMSLVGSDSNTMSGSERHFAFRFTMPETGVVTSVDFVITLANGTGYSASIWTDNAGSPGTRLGSQGTEVSVATTGTKTAPVSAPSLTGGDQYWVVLERTGGGTGNVNISFASNGNGVFDRGGRNDTITAITTNLSGFNNWTRLLLRYTPAAQIMTLVSNAFTADATPVAARAVLLVDPIDAVTLNTDLIVEISRDDGATWNPGSLVVAAQESPTIQVLATEEVDLSAQPDGQAMRIRLRAPTGKAVWVHAWALQWR